MKLTSPMRVVTGPLAAPRERFPTDRGGTVTLYVATADAEAPTVPVRAGRAWADGTRLGPVNRGRGSVPAGAFAITQP